MSLPGGALTAYDYCQGVIAGDRRSIAKTITLLASGDGLIYFRGDLSGI